MAASCFLGEGQTMTVISHRPTLTRQYCLNSGFWIHSIYNLEITASNCLLLLTAYCFCLQSIKENWKENMIAGFWTHKLLCFSAVFCCRLEYQFLLCSSAVFCCRFEYQFLLCSSAVLCCRFVGLNTNFHWNLCTWHNCTSTFNWLFSLSVLHASDCVSD